MTMHRRILRHAHSVETPEGDGMVVRRAFPGMNMGRLDPFLLLDEMGPKDFPKGSRAGFPDHPHRGFETVTYLLEGDFVHRDSQGNVGRMGPGDVQWMTAGAGVVHSEMPGERLRKEGGRFHGMQLWVNLPQRDKMVQPRYQGIPADRIPVTQVPGGVVRVIAGTFQGTKAVIDTHTPMQYLHVQLQASSRIEIPIPADQTGFVYVVSGSGMAGGVAADRGFVGALSSDGSALELRSDDGLNAIVVTGVPLGEPVFQWGPFVMNERSEIVQAIEDYNAGRMGSIPVQGA